MTSRGRPSADFPAGVYWPRFCILTLCSAANRVAPPFQLGDSEWLRRSERRLGSAELLSAIVATQREIATADLDLRRVHQLVCQRAQELTSADGAAVAEVAAEVIALQSGCGTLAALIGSEFPLQTDRPTAISQPSIRYPEIVDNFRDQVLAAAGASSGAAVPLLASGELVGLLIVVSSVPGAFDDRSCHILELLSSFAAAAVAHAAAFQQQIEEKRRTEDALQLSQKLAEVGRHAATIAHEIKTPLESLGNLMYLLDQHPGLDATARSYVQCSQQELLRATRIAQQTLDFSRESSERVRVSIPAVLDKILDFYENKVRYKKITVEKRYEDRSEVTGFPGEIRQVMSNLVVNAMEAVPMGKGRLLLHSFPSAHWQSRLSGVRILIADNGGGIHPRHRARIFEPFFTTKGKGTGLGLWTTQRLVAMLGGHIRYHTRFHPERGGTCFGVFLPSETGNA